MSEKTTREQQLEEAFLELLTKHFYSTRLEWGHHEGVGLVVANVKLYSKIVGLFPDLLEAME